MRRAQGSFIGRETELARLRAMLAEGQRLITLWGAGGIGKSRLARELVRREELPGCVVELAEVEGRAGLLSAVARALDLPLGPARRESDVAERIARALSTPGTPLLLLDGFEHLVEDAAELVGSWVELSPHSTLIVTSRERLRLPQETTLELGPMGTTGEGGGASEGEAIALFLARAGEAAGKKLAQADRGRLSALVRELEGIPLAIELAAARFELLGLDGLLARLPDKLKLLSRGARGRPSRHATMRAAIAWSWDLLSESEQRALSACAIFRGGFTMDAAERVIDSEPAERRFELVEALRDKSLLFLRDHDEQAQPRFALFDTVREFAVEKLCAERAAHILARHDAHYLEMGGEWAARIEARGDIHATELLSHELGNLLDVFERALASGNVARACDVLLAADPALSFRVSASARLSLWDRALAALDERVAPHTEARVRAAHGRAALLAGDGERALRSSTRAAELLRVESAGEASRHLPAVLLDLGLVHHTRQDLPAARAAYLEALEAAAGLGLARAEARALGNLGALLHDERQLEAARVHYGRSMSKAAQLGDARIEGIMLANLALIDQEEGHLDRAEDAYQRALRLLEQSRDRRLSAITRGNLAMLEAERRHFAAARQRMHEVIDELAAIGDARSEGLSRLRLGVIAAVSAEPALARDQLASARVLFTRLGDALNLEVVALAEVLSSGEVAASGPVSVALIDRSDDARAIVRLAEGTRKEAPPSSRRVGPRLLVSHHTMTVGLAGGVRVSLADHEAARRIMARLIAHHEAGQEEGLPAEALIAAGWPGEKLLPDAAKNRLYVVVAWLRKQGLKDVLWRRFGGYLLDPDLLVVHTAD